MRRVGSTHIGSPGSSTVDLFSVYALKLPQNEDPRGRVVEYAVYCSKRIGNRSEPGYIKDYQCAVRRNAENGRTTPLVESDATFDVAWMSDIAFAGYECKCKVRPFVFWAGRVASGARRKLDFMQRTVRELSRRGRDSRSYLVGLERNVDPVRQLLKQESFDEVEIVDGDQLERLLA